MNENKQQTRSFFAYGQTLDIPLNDVDSFLSDIPHAKEIKSFRAGDDTFDIPIDEVPDFLNDVPGAKPFEFYGEATHQETFAPTKQPIEQAQPKQSIEESGFFTEMGKKATRGANSLNQMLVNTPNTFMRLINAPFNELYEAVGLPKVNKDAFNQITGLDKVDQNLDDNNQALTKRIDAINPKANISLVESAEQGDWETFARNLAGGVVESMPTSIALMASAPATGAAAAVGMGSVMFGSSKLKEIDQQAPDMPEGLKLFTSYTNGALEGMFERYFGSGAVGGALNKLVMREGKEAGQEVIKGGLREGFSKLLTKYPLLAPFGEGYEEWATQVSQNYIDKITGYKPDQNIYEGAIDALLIGMASGGTHTLPLYAAQKLTQGAGSQQQGQAGTQQLPDSGPQFTVNPRDTKQAEIRKMAESIASKDKGTIQRVEIVKPRETDNTHAYIVATHVGKDGKAVYRTINDSGEYGWESENTIAGEPQEVGIDEFVNSQLGNYDQTNEQQELMKNNQVQIDGKQFVLTGDQTEEGYVALNPEDGSDVIIPLSTVDAIRNSGQQNANIITETYGKAKVTGIKNEDGSIGLTEPSTQEQANALLEQVEQATGGNATVEAELIENQDQTAAQQFQLRIVPVQSKSANQSIAANPVKNDNQFSFDRFKTKPSVEEMKSKIDELQKMVPSAAPVFLAQSADELPEAIRDHKAVKDGINGVFYNGKVYIMAENIKSKDHLIATWIHEVGIHNGIRNLLPANERRMLLNKVHDSFKQIAKSNPEHKKIFNKVNWDYLGSSKDVRGEEMLAWLAESIVTEKDLTPEMQSVWHQIRQYFRNLLSKLYGFDGNLLTEDQIDEIIYVSVQSNFQKQ